MNILAQKIITPVAIVVTMLGIGIAYTPTKASAKPTTWNFVKCKQEKPFLSPTSNRSHPCVKIVQRKLSIPLNTGDPEGDGFGPGPIDGIYGPKTKAAVKRFQTAFNKEFPHEDDLLVDGKIGRYTWRALWKYYGGVVE